MMNFFSHKQSLPKELLPVEDTIKLAMRPWNELVRDEGRRGVVATPMTNIVSKKYIPDLASAMRVANLILHTVQKELDPENVTVHMSKRTTRTDNGQFFHQSAVNFLASVLYYFVHKFPTDIYGDKYQVDLPHVLAFLQLDTSTILEVLETCETVRFAMLPFNVCFRNKSFDQLDAMLSTAMVDLAPLATPENFWLLSQQNTSDDGKHINHFDTDPHCVVSGYYLTVQKEVRLYVDCILEELKIPMVADANYDIPEFTRKVKEAVDGMKDIDELEPISFIENDDDAMLYALEMERRHSHFLSKHEDDLI